APEGRRAHVAQGKPAGPQADDAPAHLRRAGAQARGPAAGSHRLQGAERQERPEPVSPMTDTQVSEAPTGFDALKGMGTQEAAPVRERIVDAQGRAYATGKRKNAIARVWLKPGTGKITINGRDQEVYLARPVLRMMIAQPLEIADRATQFDVDV